MKKILSFIYVSIIVISSIQAQNVRAYLNYNEFYSPLDGQYLEAYVSVQGNSLQWVKVGDVFNASVELTVIFKLDSNIITYSKDIIKSPVASDSSAMNNVFMLTKKYLLENGEYSVDIKLDDINDTLEAFFATTTIAINNPTDSVFVSSIEVFNDAKKSNIQTNNTKAGYELSPNIYNYLGVNDSVLNFYCEIYNTVKVWKQNQDYLVSYYLVQSRYNSVLPKYKKFKRMLAEDVNVFMGSFDISKLNSGNYTLIFEVRDRANALITKRAYSFQRMNSIKNEDYDDISGVKIATTFAELIKGSDTLTDVIRSFAPVSSELEKSFAENIIKKKDDYVMQQYIYSFWEKRDPNEPFEAFKKYMKRVENADRSYGSRVNRGYETERGRVFLQYGAPNSIAREYNDPAAYPYEIWHYYSGGGQRNIRFIFYNTDLSSNEFYLLHSTAIGEPNDYQWRLHLRRDRNYQSIDEHGNAVDDWGSNYNQYYRNPR